MNEGEQVFLQVEPRGGVSVHVATPYNATRCLAAGTSSDLSRLLVDAADALGRPIFIPLQTITPTGR